MDPTTTAMVAIGIAAASEIIAISPLRSNSIIQIVIEVLMRVFPKK
jgi:hypothetical protein|tara:strand:+ start:421 stop:558 length:138 start_codon:yes stop_codon:yes gene_type:complete